MRIVVFCVWASFVPIEHIICTDVHKNCVQTLRYERKVLCSQAIHCECFLRLSFTLLNVMHCSRVDDDLGLNLFQHMESRIEFDDFDLRMCQCHYIVAMCDEGR